MSVRSYATTALLAGASCLAIVGAAPAYALCDAYSGGCPSAPPTEGGGGTDIGGDTDSPATGGGTDTPATGGGGGTDTPATGGGGGTDTGGDSDTPATGGDTDSESGGIGDGPGRAGTTSTPSTLPFTGGELVLMTAVGLGALAGGTALVVAGRRKAATVA